MTDTHADLRTGLETARAAAEAALTEARAVEQAEWDRYRISAFENRAAWTAAREIERCARTAFDLFDKACKALADTVGEPLEVETAP